MTRSIFERENEEKYGRILRKETGAELWLCLAQDDNPEAEVEEKCVTYQKGNTNLVISVPHAGTLGIDIQGCLRDISGDVLETRIGTVNHPISTYSGDAGTDHIAREIQNHLAKSGLRPHVISCHLHRSKVECNRGLGQIAVATRDGPAEHIYRTYHGWIEEALEEGRKQGAKVLMVDLHGHGHPHGYVELGYGLTAETLNQIENEKLGKITWKSVLNSQKGATFTMRNLVGGKRSSKRIKDKVVGEASFSGSLARVAAGTPGMEGIKILPSSERPSPGRLGYFSGGFTVQQHSKSPGVDAFQMELPNAARSGDAEWLAVVGRCLAEAIDHFRRENYVNAGDDDSDASGEEEVIEEEAADYDAVGAPCDTGGAPAPPVKGPPPPPPPPPCLGVRNTKSDAISHGTSLAKSRMHQELMKVAKNKLKDQSIK